MVFYVLTKEELKKLEEIYNDKIISVKKYVDKRDNRHVSRIRFLNSKPIGRYTAAWRLETIIGRKLYTSRIGGTETVDHIDNNCSNDHPNNLQVLSNYDNLYKSNVIDKKSIGENNGRSILKEKDIIFILDLYYKKRKSINEISLLYKDINKTTIGHIIHRLIWKHIPFIIPDSFIKLQNKGNSKIQEENIISIRLKRKLLNYSIEKLSKEYDVSKQHIKNIIKNIVWKNTKTPDVFYLYIFNRHILIIIGMIIIVNNIKYEFLGFINSKENIPNKNCIYINFENKVIIRTIKH